VFCAATRAEAIYVLHAFEKKRQKTSAQNLRLGRDRLRTLKQWGSIAKRSGVRITPSTGNIFRDLAVKK
jgi:hypothetical protein